MSVTAERITPVGKYDILTDYVTPGASVRVFRIHGAGERIDQHIHHKSTQIYLSIQGAARITVDGVEHIVGPYEALTVCPGIAHGAVPVGEEAILANISIPALEFDDQLPVEQDLEPPDWKLPGEGTDLED